MSLTTPSHFLLVGYRVAEVAQERKSYTTRAFSLKKNDGFQSVKLQGFWMMAKSTNPPLTIPNIPVQPHPRKSAGHDDQGLWRHRWFPGKYGPAIAIEAFFRKGGSSAREGWLISHNWKSTKSRRSASYSQIEPPKKRSFRVKIWKLKPSPFRKSSGRKFH